MSDPIPGTEVPASRRYPQQLARTLRVAGNMTITLSVIGPAASVFAIGSVALRQQGSGAFLAFLIAAVISGCLAVGWAELGALYPTAGGLYGIVARVLGRARRWLGRDPGLAGEPRTLRPVRVQELAPGGRDQPALRIRRWILGPRGQRPQQRVLYGVLGRREVGSATDEDTGDRGNQLPQQGLVHSATVGGEP